MQILVTGHANFSTNSALVNMSNLPKPMADPSPSPSTWSTMDRLEAKVLDEPLVSVLIAAGAGVILKALPLGAILGSVLRLALFFSKPALLIFLGWQAAKYNRPGKK